MTSTPEAVITLVPSASTTTLATPENEPAPNVAVSEPLNSPVMTPAVLVSRPVVTVAVAPRTEKVPPIVAVQSSALE